MLKLKSMCGAVWVTIFVALLLWGGATRVWAGEPISAERVFSHLLAQCEFGPRNPGSQGHSRCLSYITETLERAGGRVRLQEFRHSTPALDAAVDLTNISADFGPHRGAPLVLGAHWDTRPWAEEDPDPSLRHKPILGANDGASGVALLLALAESMGADPPPGPVRLVFFDGEDLGRPGFREEYAVGARYHAAHLAAPLPKMVIVVDMVASESMVLSLEETCRAYFEDLGLLVDQVAQSLEVPGYSTSLGPYVVDDHTPFLEAGLPTLLLIDFRDPVWHTHQDTPAHCSPVTLVGVTRLVEKLVRGAYF